MPPQQPPSLSTWLFLNLLRPGFPSFPTLPHWAVFHHQMLRPQRRRGDVAVEGLQVGTFGVTLPHSGPASSYVGRDQQGLNNSLSDQILTEVLEQSQPCSLRLKPLRASPIHSTHFYLSSEPRPFPLSGQGSQPQARACVPLLRSSTSIFFLSLFLSFTSKPTHTTTQVLQTSRTSICLISDSAPPQECRHQLEAQNLWHSDLCQEILQCSS